jgi:two-component system response regulator YesN
MKLLIVDDELWSRRLIKKLLPWNEYGINTILEAGGGKQAIEILERDQCELMITDMRMPGIDGAQLLEYISMHDINVEIIAMSGYEDYKYLHAALKTKAIDYLLKPVVKEELHTAVLTGVNRINKNKSHSYMENILRREDIKEELNHYHEYKIQLLHVIHQCNETEIMELSRKIYQDFFKQKNNPSFITYILSDLKRVIMEIEQEYELSFQYHDDIVPEEIEQRMLDLAKAIQEKRNDSQISILNIQKYISAHIGEALSLSTIADAFYVSKEHLSRLFKKEIGTTVQLYITSKKIAYSMMLLRKHHTLAISTIAVMCGYKDLQYFYRVFKKHNGITPLQYREQYQNNPNSISK